MKLSGSVQHVAEQVVMCGAHHCRVGKKGVKLYTVVLAVVDQAGASEVFQPRAEDEHHEVRWVALKELSGLPVDQLQPHLAEMLSEEHIAELRAAFDTPL